MERGLFTPASAVVFVAGIALVSLLAYAQGGASSSLSGVVVDSGGPIVVPASTTAVARPSSS